MEALGHQYQDVLEKSGIPNAQARKLAHTIAKLTEFHFVAIAESFEETSPQCARSLKFNCKMFFAD